VSAISRNLDGVSRLVRTNEREKIIQRHRTKSRTGHEHRAEREAVAWAQHVPDPHARLFERAHAASAARPVGCTIAAAEIRVVRSSKCERRSEGRTGLMSSSRPTPSARAAAIRSERRAANRVSTRARCSITPAVDQRSAAGDRSRNERVDRRRYFNPITRSTSSTSACESFRNSSRSCWPATTISIPCGPGRSTNTDVPGMPATSALVRNGA